MHGEIVGYVFWGAAIGALAIGMWWTEPERAKRRQQAIRDRRFAARHHYGPRVLP